MLFVGLLPIKSGVFVFLIFFTFIPPIMQMHPHKLTCRCGHQNNTHMWAPNIGKIPTCGTLVSAKYPHVAQAPNIGKISTCGFLLSVQYPRVGP